MSSKDREYFERRRDACLVNAERARSPMIAKIHRDLAEGYAALLATEYSRTATTLQFASPPAADAGGAIDQST